MVTLRSCRPGDARRIVDLTRVAVPTDAVTLDWFTDNVLLDTNFHLGGLIVAEDESGDLVGFVFAITARAGSSGIPVAAGGGWITLFAVHPDHRRRGVGRALIRAAVAHLVRHGAAWAQVAGYPPAYLIPGVDPVAHREAVALLESEGFTTRSRPAAMDLPLATHQTPEEVLALRDRRTAEGYTFAPAVMEDLPEVITHAAGDLAPDWGEVLRQAVRHHRRAERVLTVRDPRGVVVGFATYGAYGGTLERFGPFGVRDDQRGTGLGRILLYETLGRMRAEGAHVAWFLWTGEQTPAGRLYLASGFSVTRRFHVMQRELRAGGPDPATAQTADATPPSTPNQSHEQDESAVSIRAGSDRPAPQE